MSKNIPQYKDHPSPLLRAAYQLVGLSWESPEHFDFLQKLATQCEEAFQQSVHPTRGSRGAKVSSKSKKVAKPARR
jgi:hypothetical protein